MPYIEVEMEVDFWDLDMDKFHKATFDYGHRVIRKAGRAFCQVMLNEIPVWSGMALASLRPLARAVRFALPITPAPGAPNRIKEGEFKGLKGPLVSGTANMEFAFTWATSVEHFNINDQMNVNTIMNPKTGKPYFKLKNPGPWKAVAKAFEAAEAVIDAAMPKVPKPTDYMVRKRARYNPDRGGSFNFGF